MVDDRTHIPAGAGRFRFLTHRRFWPAAAIGLVIASALAWAICSGAGHRFLLTGRFFPVDQIERLNSPRPTAGWSQAGIRLADGRIVPLPGVEQMPAASKALDLALGQGIEVTSDGRVFGLLRIHHWCGNDPVRVHIARVDLAHLLLYTREVKPKTPLPKQMLMQGDEFRYSEHGWNISQYTEFTIFEETLACMAARAQSES